MKLFAESIASASKVTVAVAPMERGSPYDRGFLEGLAEGRSSPGCDARCEARTQGASIVPTIGATEDTASLRWSGCRRASRGSGYLRLLMRWCGRCRMCGSG